jgi:hypothetical protein
VCGVASSANLNKKTTPKKEDNVYEAQQCSIESSSCYPLSRPTVSHDLCEQALEISGLPVMED